MTAAKKVTTLAIADPVDVAAAAFEDAYQRYKNNPDCPPNGALMPALKKISPAKRQEHIRAWLEERLDAFVEAVRKDPLHADARAVSMSRRAMVKAFEAMGYSVSKGSVTRDCNTLREQGIIHRNYCDNYLLNPSEDLQAALDALQQAARARRQRFEDEVLRAWRRLAQNKAQIESGERRLMDFGKWSHGPTWAEVYHVLREAFPEDVPEMEVVE